MDLYGVGEKPTDQASVKTGRKFNKPSFNFGKMPRKYTGIIGLVLVVAVVGGAAFIYNNQNTNSSSTDLVLGAEQDQKSEEEAQKENAKTLEKVGELTLIPTDETPEFAEIADTTKLDDQAFFSRAQNGDKVIIFRIAKRVVLYRPSTNQVIETGPLVEPTPTPEE